MIKGRKLADLKTRLACLESAVRRMFPDLVCDDDGLKINLIITPASEIGQTNTSAFRLEKLPPTEREWVEIREAMIVVKLKDFIIDLRNNAGSLSARNPQEMSGLCAIANLFLEEADLDFSLVLIGVSDRQSFRVQIFRKIRTLESSMIA